MTEGGRSQASYDAGYLDPRGIPSDARVMSTYAERLRQAREARGWTQQELEEASGVSQETISRHEGGEREPKDPTVQRLAKPLRVSPAWLRYGVHEHVDSEQRAPGPVERVIASMLLTPAQAAIVREMAWNQSELGDPLAIVERISRALNEPELGAETSAPPKPRRRPLPKRRRGR